MRKGALGKGRGGGKPASAFTAAQSRIQWGESNDRMGVINPVKLLFCNALVRMTQGHVFPVRGGTWTSAAPAKQQEADDLRGYCRRPCSTCRKFPCRVATRAPPCRQTAPRRPMAPSLATERTKAKGYGCGSSRSVAVNYSYDISNNESSASDHAQQQRDETGAEHVSGVVPPVLARNGSQ